MHRRRPPIFVLRCVLSIVATMGVCGASVLAEEPAELSGAELDFFETRIRPVLVEHCYECHAADADILHGGLLLDSGKGVLAGGDSGPAAVPGNPEESLLLKALRYEGFEMPPDGKLSDDVIADFERWIEMGVPDPRTGGVTPQRPGIDIEEGRKFWCYQSIEPHVPPSVANAAWPYCAVDRFLLATLEERNLHPAADAPRAAWLRRVTFDLIGLPPTAEEIDAFDATARPGARARSSIACLHRRTSASAGVATGSTSARFAESSGGGRSIVFEDAWRYRDYVIDVVQPRQAARRIHRRANRRRPSAACRRRWKSATTSSPPRILLLGAHNYEEQDKRLLEMDVVDEQLDAIGRGLLGMTVACARCHDHKFDPIPTADYYALAGILRSTNALVHENVSKWTTRPLPMPPRTPPSVDAYEKSLAENEAKLIAARESKNSNDAKRVVSSREAHRRPEESSAPDCVLHGRGRRQSDRRLQDLHSRERAPSRRRRSAWRVAGRHAWRTAGNACGCQRTTGTGALDRLAAEPAHCARLRQPRLALPLRLRGWSARSTTSARQASCRRIPNCSTISLREFRQRRLVDQTPASRTRPVACLSHAARAFRRKAAIVDPENRLLVANESSPARRRIAP